MDRFREELSVRLLAAVVVFLVGGHVAIAQQTSGNTPKEIVGNSAGKVELPTPSPDPQPKLALERPDPSAILRNARVIYVRSTSLLVGASVVEDKLRQRDEFQQLGLLITREEADADIILELKHDVFTMYVFSAIDQRTHLAVAGGKLSSLGGTVAGKVAKRFLKQLLKARGAGKMP